jgi:hypothetical protein
MRIPKDVKAIISRNEDGRGTNLYLVKTPIGEDPLERYASGEYFEPNSRIVLGDQGRYDYHAFYIADGADGDLSMYYTVEK